MQHRDRVARHQPRGIEQSSIPADDDDEIRPGGERRFRAKQHAVRPKVQIDAGIDQGAYALRVEVIGEAQHALGDSHIRRPADQRDGLKGMGHNEPL